MEQKMEFNRVTIVFVNSLNLYIAVDLADLR